MLASFFLERVSRREVEVEAVRSPAGPMRQGSVQTSGPKVMRAKIL